MQNAFVSISQLNKNLVNENTLSCILEFPTVSEYKCTLFDLIIKP